MTVKSQQLLFNEDDVDFVNPFLKLSSSSYDEERLVKEKAKCTSALTSKGKNEFIPKLRPKREGVKIHIPRCARMAPFSAWKWDLFHLLSWSSLYRIPVADSQKKPIWLNIGPTWHSCWISDWGLDEPSFRRSLVLIIWPAAFFSGDFPLATWKWVYRFQW